MSTRLTNKELARLSNLLAKFQEQITERRGFVSYYDNWNYFNHLEAMQSMTAQLRSNLSEKPFDAEYWRAS